MKFKNLCKTLLLCFLSLPILAGCGGQTVAATCYGLETGKKGWGNYVFKASLSVNQDIIKSMDFEEVYMPSVWARVDPKEKTDATIETIDVNEVNLYDGNVGTVHFAKNIVVDDMVFEGVLRSDSVDSDGPYLNVGDYVRYCKKGVTSTEDALSDLERYLDVSDSSFYKLGTNYGWYFNAVKNGKIHAYGSKTNSTALDVDYTLTWPNGKMMRNEDDAFASWSSSVKSLTTYFTGKRLNYIYTVTDDQNNDWVSFRRNEDTGEYEYNPGFSQGIYSNDNFEAITGCHYADISTLNLLAYMTAFNSAYQSVEYASFN